MAFGKKRQAASTAGNAKKRPASNTAMCNVIAAELAKATSLSQSCRTMLSKMVKSSLTVYAEERHPYQAEAAAMAGETLASLQAKLEDDIAQAQAAVESAEKERASLVDMEVAAKAALDELEDSAKSAKATVDAGVAAEKTAKDNALELADMVTKKDAEMKGLQDTKSSLISSKDSYDTLKTTKVGSKPTLKGLTKSLAKAGLEHRLVESLEATLKKDVEARGSYDGIVIKMVDAFMVKKIDELEASINAWQPAKDALVAEKTAADAAHAASIEKLSASHAALAEAEVARNQGKNAYSSAVASVASCDSDLAKVTKTSGKAKTSLVAFQEGPKKYYEALKGLAPPAPEPEPEQVIENESVTAETAPTA
jgi:hypothetical protein